MDENTTTNTSTVTVGKDTPKAKGKNGAVDLGSMIANKVVRDVDAQSGTVYTWQVTAAGQQPFEEELAKAKAKYEAILANALEESGLGALYDLAVESALESEPIYNVSATTEARMVREYNMEVRDWARKPGNWKSPVGEKGRIEPALYDAFFKATGKGKPRFA